MTKTNLRAYNREIEKLIDQNNIDEAVAHCKYILKIFPKHVDSYRLLGKAYLESRHYSDAADLFLRVLSVIPDDFIAQIGMSIIREDEVNLDASIWHMERAFEIQPSNSAIQDELRRLYGRRDGLQPPKVRLTRGALVRMYARGELYPQAIAESKVALAEDSTRIDLEILQARMYYICSQKVEAAEVCNRVIIKLPYCFEANQILFDILPESAQEERKVYQQRLFSINPYSAYMTPAFATITLVPDAAVQLERLEYTGEVSIEQQPEWAQTVGADLSSSEEQTLDWLPNNANQFIQSVDLVKPEMADENEVENPDVVPQDIAQLPVTSSEYQPIIPTSEEDVENELIPDWMKAKGWVHSDQSEELNVPDTDQNLEPAQAADIPEWIQNIAPAAAATGVPEGVISENNIIEKEENLDWLTEPEVNAQANNSELPAWLLEEPASNPVSPEESVSLPATENTILPTPTEVLPAGLPDESLVYTGTNLDSDLAWLESLAERQRQNDSIESLPVDQGSIPAAETASNMPWEPQADENAPVTSEAVDNPVLDNPGVPGSLTEELPDWLKNTQKESESLVSTPETSLIWQPEMSAPVLEPTPSIENQRADQENDNQAVEITEQAQTVEPPAWLQNISLAQVENEPGHQTEQVESIGESATQETPQVEIPIVLPAAETQSKVQIAPSIESIPEWIPTSNADQLTTLAESEVFPQLDRTSSVEPAPVENHAEQNQVELPGETQIEPPAAIEENMPQEDSTQMVDLLSEAKQAADQNHIETALNQLNQLIQSKQSLEGVIAQLMEMVYRHPIDPAIWQTLGDAHFQANHLQDAIDSYTKAEEFLR